MRSTPSVFQSTWCQAQKYFPCMTGDERSLANGTPVYPESFTAMLIADLLMEMPEYTALVDEVLSMLWCELGDDEVFYFFKEHERLPADADCSAVGFSVLLRAEAQGEELRQRANRALDRIVNNVNDLGIVETYFDRSGERKGVIDPVVGCNVLYLAHQLHRAHEVQATLDYVHRVLVDEAYLSGTRYYPSPETFLYFLGRFVHAFPETHAGFLKPLQSALRKRLRLSKHPIDLAQRVWLCAWLGIDDEGEAQRLVKLLGADGTWPIDALFRYGRRKIYFGSKVLSTAFARGALAAHECAAAKARMSPSRPAALDLRGAGTPPCSGRDLAR